MGINKKVMAAIMVGVLTLSSAFTVSAAGTASENKAPAAKSEDTNTTADHLEGKTVTSDVDTTKKTATVKSVKSTADAEVKNAVVLNNARDSKNNKVPITSVGTGKKGVFNKIITRVTVKSKAKNVTFNAKAFKGSKVKTLKLNNKKTTINGNAFNGTKVKNVKIYVNGKLKVKSGAFKGLNSKAKIIVSRKAYSKKAFKKLKAALKRAGFKGKITRK